MNINFIYFEKKAGSYSRIICELSYILKVVLKAVPEAMYFTKLLPKQNSDDPFVSACKSQCNELSDFCLREKKTQKNTKLQQRKPFMVFVSVFLCS